MFWLLYILFEIFIWNPHIRSFLIGDYPLVHMSASMMNDLIWFVPAIALPVYIMIFIRRLFQRLVLRDSLSILFIVCWFVSLVNFDLFFRLQFLYMAVFLSLWMWFIIRNRTISINTIFFAVALFGIVVHYNSQLVPIPIRSGAAQLSVLSFNLNTTAAFDDERTIQFIRRRVPDIVFLQELTVREQKFIVAKLNDLYPYFLAPARGFGKNDVMILSRRDILYGDQVPLKTAHSKNYHSANHAVIEWHEQHIHLLNCHLHHAYKALGACLARPDSSYLYQTLKSNYQHQQEEARLLTEYAQRLSGPVIIAGDFNDTPNSLIYAGFKKRYQNAHASVGWGLGATFGEWIIQKKLPRFMRGLAFDIMRIDHIFFSNDFVIKSTNSEKISAFDHRPQIVTVILKQD